ncbi:uncharacterized protein LOC131626575 [Vicia villosa]|uniref:uncharacterized protein LOC131626575 n=1 Tax=Vicia villosa TaxID=3911 RepID=UPI00273B7A18|nr:uncharacterized protein LOC131626575 [Vicia villosa]
MDKEGMLKVQKLTNRLINLNALEEKVLRQKTKIEWLRLGDGNNSYFHASLKSKQKAKGILILQKEDGTEVTSQYSIEQIVVDFYGSLIGTAATNIYNVDVMAMRTGPQLNFEQRAKLILPVSDDEVTMALNCIGGLKSPGIDGFGAKFFKASWETIKFDVLRAVWDFFENGRLYKAANCTIVTLIPKSDEARTIRDYKPIEGCITLYKIISRIMTRRLASVIGNVVSQSQTTFIPHQQIHNHILLTYELLRGYSTKGGTPRYDVLIFSKGDVASIDAVLKVLQQFSSSTGLIVNPSKCKLYFGGVDYDTRNGIKMLTAFQEGALTFKYLGIPMTSRRLEVHQYMPLIEKTVARITHWSSKILSYVGKVQLVKSVCFATASYWLQCLPLPKQIINHINAICRSFIWTGGATVKRRSLVAWQTICKPRKAGGLNVLDLQVCNDIAMMKLLWSLSGKKDNLWVRWISSYYLKDNTIFQVEEKAYHS